MKRLKRMGVLLGILAVISIATLALTRYEEKQEQIQTSDAVILEIPADTVTALSWEYEDGGLAFHKGETGWLYDEDEAFPVDEEKVGDILSHFEAFGVTFIIENVEDYSQYGLDDPECTFHITTEEASYEMKLGDFSKMDEQRYVDIGDGNVYLVSRDPMDYVDSSLSSMILHDETTGFETVVDIRFTGNENYTIDRIEDSNYSYSDEDVYFIQENGKYLPLDKAAVTKYLNTISALDLTDYVTYNASEEELAACGLEEPELSVTVNYTYTDEAEQTVSAACVIHIGSDAEELAAAREAEANGETIPAVTRYVRVGDSRILYELDAVDYGILSAASYDDLRHQAVIWADFDDVTRIDITLEDTAHVLTSELNDGEERVWYYGEHIVEEPAEEETAGETTAETEITQPEEETLDISSFQSALENLYADSFTTEAPTGKEEIRLTVHLDNETFPKVDIVLYRYDGSCCLAQVDGQSVSLVSRSDVMDLVEAVQAIVLDR